MSLVTHCMYEESTDSVYYFRLFVNSWGGILRRPPHCCVKWDFNVLIEKSYFMAYK